MKYIPSDEVAGTRPSWRDRWLERGLRPLRIAEFVYERPDGNPVVKKVKFALMRTDDGRWSGEKTFVVQHRTIQSVLLGADRWDPGVGREGWETDLLYKRVELEKALRAGEDLIVCEGEKDCDSVMVEGWGAATSHYQGAAGMRLEQAAVIARCRGTVYIVMDRDVTGVQIAWRSAVLLVKAGLGPRQISFHEPAIDKVGADVSDHIKAGLGPDELRPVSSFEVREVIAEHGELPRGGWGYGYKTRELGDGQGTHDGEWKVQRA